MPWAQLQLPHSSVVGRCDKDRESGFPFQDVSIPVPAAHRTGCWGLLHDRLPAVVAWLPTWHYWYLKVSKLFKLKIAYKLHLFQVLTHIKVLHYDRYYRIQSLELLLTCTHNAHGQYWIVCYFWVTIMWKFAESIKNLKLGIWNRDEGQSQRNSAAYCWFTISQL